MSCCTCFLSLYMLFYCACSWPSHTLDAVRLLQQLYLVTIETRLGSIASDPPGWQLKASDGECHIPQMTPKTLHECRRQVQ